MVITFLFTEAPWVVSTLTSTSVHFTFYIKALCIAASSCCERESTKRPCMLLFKDSNINTSRTWFFVRFVNYKFRVRGWLLKNSSTNCENCWKYFRFIFYRSRLRSPLFALMNGVRELICFTTQDLKLRVSNLVSMPHICSKSSSLRDKSRCRRNFRTDALSSKMDLLYLQLKPQPARLKCTRDSFSYKFS